MREVRDRLTSCARRIASESRLGQSAIPRPARSIIDREHLHPGLLVSSFRERSAPPRPERLAHGTCSTGTSR